MAIQSFRRSSLESFYLNGRVPKGTGWFKVARIALRKLDMLDYASTLADLASPPGNRLEPLKAGLSGLHSIRVNNRWRIVFRWTDAGPTEVDIVDYH